MDDERQEPYLNRELSWLEFNQRVLAEAENSRVPLLERVKFLSIFASNLDEFYMVRVAGLRKIMQGELEIVDSPDSRSAAEILKDVKVKTEQLIARQNRCLQEDILPQLAEEGIHFRQAHELTEEEKKKAAEYFHESVAPVLTPLAIDPAHPFPYMVNLALYLVAVMKADHIGLNSEMPIIGLVEIPSILPRLVPLSDGKNSVFMLLEDLVASQLDQVFVGFHIKEYFSIRVTRNLDYNLLESEVVDLLKSVQKEVMQKRDQEVVRLEIPPSLPKAIKRIFTEALNVSSLELFLTPAPLRLSGLMALYSLPREDLKDPPFNPRLPPRVAISEDIFQLIDEQDLLVHHPFESFYTVTEFLQAAATDPNVLAIKQTLYRSSGDSPIIDSLITAAENGKQVAAVIELKARFDEKNNIVWARRLERAGVHVVFGFIGYKTHTKATLVVRREQKRLKRYVHLATGNYNSTTARLYTDIGVFTTNPAITEDVANLFNLLTGYNILAGEHHLRDLPVLPKFKSLVLAPFNLRLYLLEKIDREIAQHKKTKDGWIIAKMNALVDKAIIDKLYEASAAGVKINLLVRGMCCLMPQVKGLSETIEVTSVIDRFLEHSRIFYFHHGGSHDVYLSSADWMPRNFDRRIEALWPITDPSLKQRLINDILYTYLADHYKTWVLQANGTYVRRSLQAGEKTVRAQQHFIDLARQAGVKSIPYEHAIRYKHKRKGDRPVAEPKHGKKRRKWGLLPEPPSL